MQRRLESGFVGFWVQYKYEEGYGGQLRYNISVAKWLFRGPFYLKLVSLPRKKLTLDSYFQDVSNFNHKSTVFTYLRGVKLKKVPWSVKSALILKMKRNGPKGFPKDS